VSLADPVLRLAAVLLAALGGHGALAPPHLHDTPVVAYRDAVAWWDQDESGRRGEARLTVWRAGERAPRRLPVRSGGPVGHGLDLGPGPDGGIWATYPPCDAVTHACRLHGYDLGHGIDRDLGIGGAALAAIWGERIAYVPLDDGHDASRLRVARIGGRGLRVGVFVAPVDGDGTRTTITGLDLRGRRVAYTAWGERAEVLRLQTPNADDSIDVARGSSGEECTYDITGPAFTARTLTWLRADRGARDVCRVRPAAYRLWEDSGRIERAPLAVVAPVAGALLADGRAAILAPAAGTAAKTARDACSLAPGHATRLGCELRLARTPRWRAAHS
jgi:hypothetical protein